MEILRWVYGVVFVVMWVFLTFLFLKDQRKPDLLTAAVEALIGLLMLLALIVLIFQGAWNLLTSVAGDW